MAEDERKVPLADRWPTMQGSPFNMDWKVADREHGVLCGGTEFRRKVCIVGAGQSRPFAHDILVDSTWEVWALNAVCPRDSHGRARADRWFDIHQRVAQSPDDMRWIAMCPMPIYVPDDLLDAGENTVRLPIEDLELKYGSYWSCTFAYQIALALHEGAQEIALFGVDLHYGDQRERSVELACVSWWMGYAEAKGVRIALPAGSMLGTHKYRYGLEYTAEKEDTEQYVRIAKLADMQRDFAKLRSEVVAHMPGESKVNEDLAPAGVGG